MRGVRFCQRAARSLHGSLVRRTSACVRKRETLDLLAWTLPDQALVHDSALAVGSGTEDVFVAAGDVAVQAVDGAGIDGRRLAFLQHALPQPAGPFGRLHGSGVAPVLEVPPVRQQETVEGRLLVLQGVAEPK